MTTPGPALNSPILGAGANPSVGAMAAVSKQVKSLQNAQHKIVAGTVVDNSGIVSANNSIGVQIDGAPTSQLVQGHILNGWVPAGGTRVLCLLYPPRGVIILGQISDSVLTTQTGPSTVFVGQNFGTFQVYTNGAYGGVLYLNNAGGTVVSTPMRNQYARDVSGTHSGLTSTSFVQYGASMQILLQGSGIIQIMHKTRLGAGGAASQTFQADVIVHNLTQSTIPYAGSANNSFNYSGVVPTGGGTAPIPGVDICGFLSVGGSAGAQGGILGNLGDTINVGIAYAVTGGTWSVLENALSLTPSF